jgi:hypothetical protein
MMNNQLLPAILLPNKGNADDTNAVVASGDLISVTDLLRNFDVGDNLRFMIQASDLKTASSPRVTWQTQRDGRVIVSAAFACGQDAHGRLASAALVFDLTDASRLSTTLPAGLPVDEQECLMQAISELAPNLTSHVDESRILGIYGGEFRGEKKNHLGGGFFHL